MKETEVLHMGRGGIMGVVHVWHVCVHASGCAPAVVCMYVYLVNLCREKHLQAVSENSPFQRYLCT